MTFFQDIAFWGLIAFTAPVLIHLLSKKKKNEIRFGSLQFLMSSESPAAKSIRLTDHLLLLLRLFIIGLICFLLAKPLLFKENNLREIYIERALFESSDFSDFKEDLVLEKNLNIILFTYHKKLESEGVQWFPSSWTLIEKLNTHGDSAYVYTYSFDKNYLGSSTRLSNTIKWNIFPKKQLPPSSEITVWNDGIRKIDISVEDDKTTWDIASTEQIGESSKPSIPIKVSHAKKSIAHAQTIMKLLGSLQKSLPYNFAFNETDNKWTILIDTFDTTLDSKTIVWRTNSFGRTSIFKEADQLYRLDGAINQESLLEDNLAVQLSKVFTDDWLDIESYNNIVYNPQRSSPAIIKGEIPKDAYPARVQRFLWLMVILLLISERWLSSKTATSDA